MPTLEHQVPLQAQAKPPNPAQFCPDCFYIQAERSAHHQFDGGASRAQADLLASRERCEKHEEPLF